MASLVSMVAAVAGAIFCDARAMGVLGFAAGVGGAGEAGAWARDRPEQVARKSRITQTLSLNFLGISCCWGDCSLGQLSRPGRFMRLGWRYQPVIRTFRNHAAVSFSQCTGGLSASQGRVFGRRRSSRATRNVLVDSKYMDQEILSRLGIPLPGSGLASNFSVC